MSQISITFDGETYEWTGKIMLSEMSVIQYHTGYHYVDFMASLDRGEGPSLQALLSLLKKHKLQPCDIKTLDFDIVAFMEAFGAAAAEAEAKAKEKDDPKGRRRVKADPTPD